MEVLDYSCRVAVGLRCQLVPPCARACPTQPVGSSKSPIQHAADACQRVQFAAAVPSLARACPARPRLHPHLTRCHMIVFVHRVAVGLRCQLVPPCARACPTQPVGSSRSPIQHAADACQRVLFAAASCAFTCSSMSRAASFASSPDSVPHDGICAPGLGSWPMSRVVSSWTSAGETLWDLGFGHDSR